MGRIVRRFAKFHQLELTHDLQIGSRGTPLTQTEVIEAVVGAFIDTSAIGIGWDIHGVWAWVTAAVDRDGDIVGVEGRAYVDDGVTIGGNVYGLHSRISIEAGATIDQDFEGLHVFMNINATGTVTQNVNAIKVHNVMANQPVGHLNIITLDQSGAVDIDAFIEAVLSGGSGIEYFLNLDPSPTNAWSGVGTPAAPQAGWIRIAIAGVDKWIRLYETAP